MADGSGSRLSGQPLIAPAFAAGLQRLPELRDNDSSINCNISAPVPELGSISGTASFGFGNYDALTAKLEKRFSKGLQFIASYTYGHALANSGTTLSGSSGFGYKDNLNYFDLLRQRGVGHPAQLHHRIHL